MAWKYWIARSMPLVTTMARRLPPDPVLGEDLLVEVVDHDLGLEADCVVVALYKAPQLLLRLLGVELRVVRHRVSAPHPGCAPCGHARWLCELRDHAQGELPLLAGPELPAGEPRPESPLACRRHSFLDLGHDLLGRGPPEARQQRRRDQVGVPDRSRSLAVYVADVRAALVRQLQHELLVALVDVLVEHRDVHRLLGLAGGEGTFKQAVRCFLQSSV